jgi:hypothetical protein
MRFSNSFIFAAMLTALMACDSTPPVKSQFLQPGSVADRPITGTLYALPLSRLRVTVTKDSADRPILNVTRVNYADLDARYIAQAFPSSSANDDIILGTDGSGLLNFATVSSDEVSDEIVKTAAAGVSSLIAARSGSGNLRMASATPDINTLIDPYTHNGTGMINVKWLGPRLPITADGKRRRCPKETSICVPVMVPVEVTLTTKDNVETKAVIAVPDRYASIGIRLHRRPCVNTINTLTMSEGILTRFDIEKPSELAGCLSIPLDILTAIISAPIDAFRSETAALAAQAELLNAQAALLEAQTALASAQKETTSE